MIMPLYPLVFDKLRFFLNLVSTTPAEVQLMIKSLQLGKGACPVSTDYHILKELAVPVSFPLSDFFFQLFSKSE